MVILSEQVSTEMQASLGVLADVRDQDPAS